jgi:hypothetical protein
MRRRVASAIITCALAAAVGVMLVVALVALRVLFEIIH